MTLLKRPAASLYRRRKQAALAAAVCAGMLFGVANPAAADYSGSVSSVGGGATLSYTVLRLNPNAAEAVGTIKDTWADGYCAYAKVWVVIDYAVDPYNQATTCGVGTTARLSVYTRDLNGWDRIQSIKLMVCRRSGSTGSLFNCNYRTLTQETF